MPLVEAPPLADGLQSPFDADSRMKRIPVPHHLEQGIRNTPCDLSCVLEILALDIVYRHIRIEPDFFSQRRLLQ